MRGVAWRPFLLSICAITAFLSLVNLAGQVGFGGRPAWLGLWGATYRASTQPLKLVVVSVDSGGASAAAGLRAGDRIDISKNPLVERFSITGQPLSGRPINLSVQRSGQSLQLNVVPRPLDFRIRWDVLASDFGTLLILLFAGVIAARRSHVREMRLLSLTLVLYASGFVTDPGWYAAPWPFVYVLYDAYGVVWPLSIALWAHYASGFSLPLSRERVVAQQLCFAFVAVAIAVRFLALIGIVTLWFRPVLLSTSLTSTLPLDLAIVSAIACSVLAIAESRGAVQQRAVWSIVPLAVMIAVVQLTHILNALSPSYEGFILSSTVGNLTVVIAPVVLTYAALNRRLIDIGFVLNRALIFGIVSIVVVAAFLLIEWAFSEWFVEANHITGNFASMLVALGLGFSMRYIHSHVDRAVDQIFFRKRYENEAALRRFSQEAGYITDRSVLLDRTVQEIKEHTEETDVAIWLLQADRTYTPLHPAKAALPPIDENDEALVAMRTWRKPVDLGTLHRSAFSGEFAFPMSARGTLVGVIVCESQGNAEVYAPDESDAILTIAQAVAAALVSFDVEQAQATTEIRNEIAALSEQIRLLAATRGEPGESASARAAAAQSG
jgi:hypothetical protein